MAKSADFVLKVDLEGDVRRFRITAGADDAETWEVLAKTVREGFELPAEETVRLKYKDDEGDECTLTKATLPDCLELSTSGMLRLRAARLSSSAPAAAAPEADRSTDAADGGANPDAFGASGSAQSTRWPPSKGKGAGKGKGKAKGWWAALFSPAPAGQEWGGEAAYAGNACYGAPGPWKLIQSLGGLHGNGKLSANMVGSLAFQYLPILSQRLQRKQEKINYVGAVHREALLPTLHRIIVHLEGIEEAAPVKASLEAFVSGSDTSKLGDALSALLKMMVASTNRKAIVSLIKGASEELVDLLPRLFNKWFGGSCTRMAWHAGVRCQHCSAEPLPGPRFHDPASGRDMCGDCFIEHLPESPAAFECRLWAPDAADPRQAWHEQVRAWREQVAAALKDVGKAPLSSSCDWRAMGKGLWAAKASGKGKCSKGDWGAAPTNEDWWEEGA
mmetsp:Transcript_18339/g.52418  ORF Transcript_18339/g.52418 Transcript_18339/m.52418 type:complete len:446 (-) Transcript_18339:262-1599(-)